MDRTFALAGDDRIQGHPVGGVSCSSDSCRAFQKVDREGFIEIERIQDGTGLSHAGPKPYIHCSRHRASILEGRTVHGLSERLMGILQTQEKILADADRHHTASFWRAGSFDRRVGDCAVYLHTILTRITWIHYSSNQRKS